MTDSARIRLKNIVIDNELDIDSIEKELELSEDQINRCCNIVDEMIRSNLNGSALSLTIATSFALPSDLSRVVTARIFLAAREGRGPKQQDRLDLIYRELVDGKETPLIKKFPLRPSDLDLVNIELNDSMLIKIGKLCLIDYKDWASFILESGNTELYSRLKKESGLALRTIEKSLYEVLLWSPDCEYQAIKKTMFLTTKMEGRRQYALIVDPFKEGFDPSKYRGADKLDAGFIKKHGKDIFREIISSVYTRLSLSSGYKKNELEPTEKAMKQILHMVLALTPDWYKVWLNSAPSRQGYYIDLEDVELGETEKVACFFEDARIAAIPDDGPRRCFLNAMISSLPRAAVIEHFQGNDESLEYCYSITKDRAFISSASLKKKSAILSNDLGM